MINTYILYKKINIHLPALSPPNFMAVISDFQECLHNIIHFSYRNAKYNIQNVPIRFMHINYVES